MYSYLEELPYVLLQMGKFK